jgi:hypothetical protein
MVAPPRATGAGDGHVGAGALRRLADGGDMLTIRIDLD